ncbi:MAG: 16S rRNA (cytidine(1402)-2'-O)-methyltransferase [Atopobiaceae bacterium]
MAGMLSMVGTPIGNLQDVSPRVREVLGRADAIFCEDTRVTGKLLSVLGIHVRLERADENIIAQKIAPTLERIEAGERIAFVSDAGMPGISDPGQRLVDAALDAGLPCEVIPGPSAVICALVASGLSSEHFFFEGFLPRKAGDQRRRLAELARVPGSLVIYESPRRVVQTAAALAEAFPERRCALVRELTKIHEECVRGRAPELAEELAARPEIKGECVFVVEAPTEEELASLRQGSETKPTLEEAIAKGLAEGEPKSGLAKRLSKEYGASRQDIYAQILAAAQDVSE